MTFTNEPAELPVEEQAVAALEVLVQQRGRTARFAAFQPEVDFREIDGPRVDVHAVDRTGNHVAERLADCLRGRLRAAAADRRQPPRDSPGRCDKEMARAAGRVADLEIENRRCLRLGRGTLGCFVEDRIESGIQEHVDQRGGRVVAPGSLPPPGCRDVELEDP
jgi:hypothetical protein